MGGGGVRVFEITNTPRPYAWGSTSALAELRGVSPSGNPEAEIWFGDHEGSPATRVDDGRTLGQWEADTGSSELPFLLKILAVATPLSIQVHPTREAARAGFTSEDLAGTPLDSPTRNYKDANHKPEIIRAVTEFSALSGFRTPSDRTAVLEFLVSKSVAGAAELAEAHTFGLREVVERIVRHDPSAVSVAAALLGTIPDSGSAVIDDAIATAQTVARAFPSDPGATLALLLNHIVLSPGKALAVPAGTVHAYLSGVGVEVMASSDNVLRGGCTAKHIDADEFLSVVDWDERPAELITPDIDGPIARLRASFDDCQLIDISVEGDVTVSVTTPAIALVIDGVVTLASDSQLHLTPGRAAFLEPSDVPIHASGRGILVVATRAE
jgi:mannose-6-phosphate isomerase